MMLFLPLAVYKQFCAQCMMNAAEKAFACLHILMLGVCFISLLACWTACTEQADEKPIGASAVARSMPFDTPTEFTARKIETRRMDITRNGYEDVLLMVYPSDSLGARIGFETLAVYEYDTTKQAFYQAFRGTYYYGKNVEVRDLTGDGIPELCIRIDGGGNSENASIGMAVLGRQGNTFRTIAALEYGNPELITLADDSTFALLSKDEYYPEYLPPNEAVATPDSLIVFAKTPERAALLKNQYFMDAAQKARQRYMTAKETVQSNRSQPALLTMYSEAVVTMRLLGKLPQPAPLKEFIAQERPYWRAVLPKRLHNALDDLFREHP